MLLAGLKKCFAAAVGLLASQNLQPHDGYYPPIMENQMEKKMEN